MTKLISFLLITSSNNNYHDNLCKNLDVSQRNRRFDLESKNLASFCMEGRRVAVVGLIDNKFRIHTKI